MRAHLILPVLALGFVQACSSTPNPCAGVTEACIAATVSGNMKDTDQLRIIIDAIKKSTPSTPARFALPVETAIILPATLAGRNVRIVVEALAGGIVVGADAKLVFMTPAVGQQVAAAFTLQPVGQVGDGGMSADAAPSGLEVTPTTLAFPDTAVGQQSASMMILVRNTSSADIPVGTTPTTTGDKAMFPFDSSSTCMNLTTALPSKMSCTLSVSFKPTSSGVRSATFQLPIDNAPLITFSGTALRAWVDETITGGMNFRAVHGTGPDNIFAVNDGGGTDSVYHYDGTQWTPVSGTATLSDRALTSVFALGPGNLWVGAHAKTGYIDYSADGGANYVLLDVDSSASTGNVINQLLALDAGDVYAVTGGVGGGQAAAVLHYAGMPGVGTWTTYSTPFTSGTASIFSIASYGSTLMVGASAGQVAFRAATNVNFGPALNPQNVSSGVPVTGAWGDPLSARYYFVGGSTTSSGYSVFTMTSGQSMATVQHNMTGAPTAIHGRAISATERDIYVVGSFDNQILHSTGDTNWHAVQLPTSGPMNGVYVAPNGDVVAVGSMGQIAHYR